MLRRLEELLKQKEWVQLKREAEALLRLPDLDDYSLGRTYRYLGRASFGLRQFDLAAGYLEVGIPYSTRAGDWDGCWHRHYLASAVGIFTAGICTWRGKSTESLSFVIIKGGK